MTLEQAAAFLIFCLVAAITPGPTNVMLTTTGASVGVLRGLPCLAGVAAGMGLLMFSVAAGMGQLVAGNPGILRILNWVGAAFLLWLSWRIATASHGKETAAGTSIGFLEAAAFQWINPKSWLVSSSAAATYLHPDAGGTLPQALAFAALFIVASVPSSFAWLAFGAAMHRFLRDARTARIFNIVMGASLAASVVLILR